MKYIEEYRNRDHVKALVERINSKATRKYRFMEVCGGHTHAIRKFGIPSLIHDKVELISGPGCPVCVTSKIYIEKAIQYAYKKNCVVATYGDLIRVPGYTETLENAKAQGANVQVVTSAMEAMGLAVQETSRRVIFLAIGFETTAPGTAVTVREAFKARLANFYILSAHKIMPPAMKALLEGAVDIDGFICPGHVSVVTGPSIFEFIPLEYSTGCAISGFEPVDLLQAILSLVNQCENKNYFVDNQYRRAVTASGNIVAQFIMQEVFQTNPDWWRGLGVVPGSGLKLRDQYKQFDIEFNDPVIVAENLNDEKGCLCGEVLQGLKRPNECPLFRSRCTPEYPVGACMVSEEGTCNAFYKYEAYV